MIINPWFFYLLQLANNMRGFLAGIGAVSIGIGVVLFIENDISRTTYKVKRWFIVAVVCFMLFSILPSRDTLLLMKASEFVTYDNVNLTVNTLKAAIDYAATLF